LRAAFPGLPFLKPAEAPPRAFAAYACRTEFPGRSHKRAAQPGKALGSFFFTALQPRSVILAVRTPFCRAKALAPPFFSAMRRTD